LAGQNLKLGHLAVAKWPNRQRPSPAKWPMANTDLSQLAINNTTFSHHINIQYIYQYLKLFSILLYL
jgi:hypothetical protein